MNRTLITIICFAIVVGVGIFWVWPKYQDYQKLASEVSRRETELQYFREYATELREISQKLEPYQEAISKIEDFLPAEFSIPAFYANVQNMSSQSGMILTGIAEAGVQEEEGVKIRSYKISVAGNYSNFKNFLSILEKSAKLIEVENFGFAAKVVEEKEGGNFTIGIKTYSY